MQIQLPDLETLARIEIDEQPMSDRKFFEFCSVNSDVQIERLASGEIIIMPPAGFETGYRNNDIGRQLGNWAKRDRRGVALDSNTEYLLPNGAALAPDASWVHKSRLAGFTKEQKKQFLPLCPDFVIELLSPTDRLARLKAKMQEWVDNGAQVAWLIDADRRTVHIYRPGGAPELIETPASISGEGPVEGFRLELEDIWEGV